MSAAVSRLEVDIRCLLSKCENMVKKDDFVENWRIPKFVETLQEMIKRLENSPLQVERELLVTYKKRTEFLERLLEAEKMENSIQKSVAVQMLAPPPSLNSSVTKEIYQKSMANCENDLRKELFQDSSELRQRFSSAEPSGSQELDSILRFHHEKHEQIAADMLTMTRSMKEQSELAGKIIREDTKVLEKSVKGMDDNYFNLQKQSNRLTEFISKSSWNCWVWILIAITVVIFVNMVFFMKIAKKRY